MPPSIIVCAVVSNTYWALVYLPPNVGTKVISLQRLQVSLLPVDDIDSRVCA